MILTKEQIEQFETSAKPLIEFLCSLPCPHVKVIVEPDRAEIMSGSAMILCDEFIKD